MGAMGDSAASLMTCEPIEMRPQWELLVRQKHLNACFVILMQFHPIFQKTNLEKASLIKYEKINKKDMLHKIIVQISKLTRRLLKYLLMTF